MHLSLSYDCCLTEEEIQNFNLVFRRWLGQTRFNLHLHFTHLECWLERPETGWQNFLLSRGRLPIARFNSLTVIAVVDPAAQKELLRWNHQLKELLQNHGIPVPVRREIQMLEGRPENTFHIFSQFVGSVLMTLDKLQMLIVVGPN